MSVCEELVIYSHASTFTGAGEMTARQLIRRDGWLRISSATVIYLRLNVKLIYYKTTSLIYLTLIEWTDPRSIGY